MEELEKSDITEVLTKLEDGYDIIRVNFFEKEIDFLAMGDSLLEANVLPSIDLPLTLTDYLGYLKKE